MRVPLINACCWLKESVISLRPLWMLKTFAFDNFVWRSNTFYKYWKVKTIIIICHHNQNNNEEPESCLFKAWLEIVRSDSALFIVVTFAPPLFGVMADTYKWKQSFTASNWSIVYTIFTNNRRGTDLTQILGHLTLLWAQLLGLRL